MRQPLQHLWVRVQVSLGLFQVVRHPGFLQMNFRAVSVMCKRGANPDSLERLGSTQVLYSYCEPLDFFLALVPGLAYTPFGQTP